MITPVFNYEKSVQVILYIVSKLERRDFHKIFKILYFADREHLSKFGRTITGDHYIAMKAGPVPSNIYDLFKAIKGDSYFSKDELKAYFEVENEFFIKPKKDPDLDEISNSDINVLNEVLAKYGDMDFETIKRKSHDFAWNQTSRDAKICMENILKESGESQEYIEYVMESLKLDKAFV